MDRVEEFAKQYGEKCLQAEYNLHKYVDLISPSVYVVVGDKSRDAVESILYEARISKNLDNTIVLFIGTEKLVDSHFPNVFQFLVEMKKSDRKTMRKNLHSDFYANTEKLVEINKTLRDVKAFAQARGTGKERLLDKLNVSVITSANDEINIIIPEISILVKNSVSADFKIINIDLYCLLTEKNDIESFEYNSALTVSFLKELEYVQQTEYKFNERLRRSDDGVDFEINHKGKLFDLVFFLSDKNAEGSINPKNTQKNYKIINMMNYIKNVNPHSDNYTIGFNEAEYMKIIESSKDVPVYSSAGIAELIKPNEAIAAAVFTSMLNLIKETLQKNIVVGENRRNDLYTTILNESEIENAVNYIFQNRDEYEMVSNMYALMNRKVPLKNLNNRSFREAEKLLYENSCEEFFNSYYADFTEKNFESETQPIKARLEKNIYENIIKSESLGLYYAYDILSDAKFIENFKSLENSFEVRINEQTQKIQFMYEENYSCGLLSSLFSKNDIKDIQSALFEKIYTAKYNLQRFLISKKIINYYRQVFSELQKQLKEKIELYQKLITQSELLIEKYSKDTENYQCNNLQAYYKKALKQAISRHESQLGEKFYLSDRHIGNVCDIIDENNERLISKIIEFLQKNILTELEFNQSFDEELQARSAVSLDEPGDRISSSGELLAEIYNLLEKTATINVSLIKLNDVQLEEKYFFGNCEGKFMKYAMSKGPGLTVNKIGCVNENNSGSIKKLNLMGGFIMSDLMLLRSFTQNYEAYKSNGFDFHAIAALN